MRYFYTRLLVTHFTECFRFYRDVLQLVPAWGDETGGYASFKDAPDGRLVLAIFDRQAQADVVGTGSLPADPPAQDRCLLTFTVADVDADVERLRQQGVKIELGPTDFPDWGFRGAYLRDPSGTLIELSGELPAEAWSDDLRQENEKYT